MAQKLIAVTCIAAKEYPDISSLTPIDLYLLEDQSDIVAVPSPLCGYQDGRNTGWICFAPSSASDDDQTRLRVIIQKSPLRPFDSAAMALPTVVEERELVVCQ